MKTKEPILVVKDIEIRAFNKFYFAGTSWQMRQNEQWAIIGPNGSGKSIFTKAVAGILPLKQGEVISNKKVVYLSFDIQQDIVTREERILDLESGIGAATPEITVKEFLGHSYKHFRFKDIFSVDIFFEKSLLKLSTGEMRKVFLIKTLLQNPELLILDEPFDGLDSQAKQSLENIISALMEKINIILIVHNQEEIIPGITNILVMKNCQIFLQGEKTTILQNYLKTLPKHHFKKNNKKGPLQKNNILIYMKDVTVAYHKKTILDSITWTVRKGENWVVLGHNGAGKSTLMHLISGDNQQAYANNITLLGKRKGRDISVGEIKQHIGIISTNLMLHYDKEITADEVILSGFFDSIGLYQKVNEKQRKEATKWINKLKLQKFIDKPYQQLSFGQKRLILIARAVVKSPTVVIADEPFHGLDTENREMVFEILDTIGTSGKTNIILITHKESEILPCITNKLILKNGKILVKEKIKNI